MLSFTNKTLLSLSLAQFIPEPILLRGRGEKTFIQKVLRIYIAPHTNETSTRSQ